MVLDSFMEQGGGRWRREGWRERSGSPISSTLCDKQYIRMYIYMYMYMCVKSLFFPPSAQ